MGIGYQDVVNFTKEKRSVFELALKLLDDLLIKGRDEKNIPIYLTKTRVKSPDSIYLKTKRRDIRSLNQIRDLAGMRVLCLFEQDLYEVNEFIVSELPKRDFQLLEAEIYNWSDDYAVQRLQALLSPGIDQNKVKLKQRESGYKSIHYSVQYRVGQVEVAIEVQLRTLLQDVWGELEHALSYKQGSIHPHIKESFRLLAMDLQTNDALMAHLKTISEKERSGRSFSRKHSASPFYFGTENELLPNAFISGQLQNEYQKYKTLIEERRDIPDSRVWIREVERSYENLVGRMGQQERNEKKAQYWVPMERTYIVFMKCDFDSALEQYESYRNCFPDHYTFHFRLGEIYFILGENVKALAEFDMTEDLLKNAGSAKQVMNQYRVKTKLAHIYWMLGSEYIDQALEQIKGVSRLYAQNGKQFSPKEYRKLINNLCWYKLEKYLLSSRTDRERYFTEAKEEFEKLKELLGNDAMSNDYDTAAWFCYHAYRKTKEEASLDLAKMYCQEAWERKPEVTLELTSLEMHKNHIQEIMSIK